MKDKISKVNMWIQLQLTTERVLFYVCLFFLILLRLIGFGLIPGGMNQDGAMAGVDALALANYGTDRFGTWMPSHLEAWTYGQMSALLSYCMIPFVKIWGLNAITAGLPILIVSILGALAMYGIVKRLCGYKAAI